MTKLTEIKDDGTSFGHGKNNPGGLHLQFTITKEKAEATVNLPAAFQGWAGVLHGGIVASILDEAMGHSVRASVGSSAMSVELHVSFKGPALVDEDLVATGYVTKAEGRKINTESELRRKSDNTLLATGSGLFILMKSAE